MNYSKKIRNFENVSNDYFEENETNKQTPDDKEKQPERKSFFGKLFGK
jgi:hypothetical protein